MNNMSIPGFTAERNWYLQRRYALERWLILLAETAKGHLFHA